MCDAVQHRVDRAAEFFVAEVEIIEFLTDELWVGFDKIDFCVEELLVFQVKGDLFVFAGWLARTK